MENSKPNINLLISANKLNGLVDLYYYVANDKIGFKTVKEILQPQESLVGWMKNIRFPFVRTKIAAPSLEYNPDEGSKQDLLFKENGNDKDFNPLEYSVSKCCNPIPGDNVVGIIFPNEPIQIHKTNCNNAIRLMSQYGKNIVKAKWKQKEDITFLAGIKIKATDKFGFIKQIVGMITDDFNLNIRTFNLESTEGLINLSLSLYVSSTDKLNQLIHKLKKTKEIIKVTRLDQFD